jgi:ankyrin repeat protein
MFKKLLKTRHTVETFKRLLRSKAPNVEEIKEALENDVDVNFVDKKGESFLHYVIKKGYSASGKLLIECGIDVTLKDKNGKSYLYLAVNKDDKIITQAILATKKVITSELNENRTLLQDAVLNDDISIVNMLLRTDINIGHTDSYGRNVIFDAIANGNEKIIESILQSGDIDLNKKDNKGEFLLDQKNVIENEELAKLLISKGANPTILGVDGKSYLLKASLKGLDVGSIVDILTKNGLSLNATKENNNNSVLKEIVLAYLDLEAKDEKTKENIIKAIGSILSKGIDVDMVDKDGDTVLMQLVYQGMSAIDIIKLIVKSGANIDFRNKYNQNVIEILSDLVLFTNGNIDTINIPENKINENGKYKLLLQEMLKITKYDVGDLSSQDEPIFFKSLLCGNRELFAVFCKFDFNINARDMQFNNIFSKYVETMAKRESLPKDFKETVVTILNKKVDVNAQNKTGDTTLSKLIDIGNMVALKTITNIAKFDFTVKDARGYTIIHKCIPTSNIAVIRLINQKEPKLKNIPDKLGLLPITYAALFGKTEVVLELMALESNFSASIPIPQVAKQKLSPLLGGLKNLQDSNKDKQYKLNRLIEQIKKDFR